MRGAQGASRRPAHGQRPRSLDATEVRSRLSGVPDTVAPSLSKLPDFEAHSGGKGAKGKRGHSDCALLYQAMRLTPDLARRRSRPAAGCMKLKFTALICELLSRNVNMNQMPNVRTSTRCCTNLRPC
jgi:hypothetical protein